MNRILPLLLLTFASAALGVSPIARPSVTAKTINGFQVHLVNLGRGEKAGYQFLVPFGSADRFPLAVAPNERPAQWHMGIAHLFEHLYSRGSLLYPGHDTLIEAMSKFGFMRNASTGLDLTTFHGSGPEIHLVEAMRMHLAGLKGIELEPSSVKRERLTVINEVVETAPQNPGRAALLLPFMVLPADSHPLKGYLLGETEVLNAIDAKAMRSLLETIYHSGNLQLTVFGNFSPGHLDSEKVFNELKTILPVGDVHKKESFKPALTPHIFSEREVKTLEIDHPAQRSAILFFDLDSGANLKNVKRFISLLSRSDRGGLLDNLRRGRGWVDSMSGDAYRVGSRGLAYIELELTDLGFQNREAAIQSVLGAIEYLQSHPFQDWQLQSLRNRELTAGKFIESSVESLMGAFRTWMAADDYEAEKKLNWAAAAQEINPYLMIATARRLRVSPKAHVYFGPLHLENAVRDPVFQLPYRLSNSTANPQPFNFSGIEETQLTLGRVAPNEALVTSNESIKSMPGWSEAFLFDSTWTDRTFQAEYTFGPMTTLERLALSSWIESFILDHSPELSKIKSEYDVRLDFEVGFDRLSVVASGHADYEPSALIWALRTLKVYSPDSSRLALSKEKIELGIKQTELGHPANVAQDVLADLIGRSEVSNLEMGEALQNVNPAAIERLKKRIQVSEKRLYVAGPYREGELKAVKDAFNAFSPLPLLGPAKSRYRKPSLKTTIEYQEPWTGTVQPGFGIALAIPVPKVSDLRSMAALAVATPLLHQKIFLAARPYGYVHGATRFDIDDEHSYLALLGQTNSASDIGAVRSLWAQYLEEWKTGQVDLVVLEKIRKAQIATRRLPFTTSSAALASLEISLDLWGQPGLRRALADEIEKLSVAEIAQIVRDNLNAETGRLLVTKGGAANSCEEILRQRSVLRDSMTTK